MLVFPISLRDIFQPAHKPGACLHPLLVPHVNHPEKLFCFKHLMTLTYFLLYAIKLHETRRNTMSQKAKMLCVSKQGSFFVLTHTHNKPQKRSFQSFRIWLNFCGAFYLLRTDLPVICYFSKSSLCTNVSIESAWLIVDLLNNVICPWIINSESVTY